MYKVELVSCWRRGHNGAKSRRAEEGIAFPCTGFVPLCHRGQILQMGSSRESRETLNREHALRTAIAALPRIPLGVYPTPMDMLSRLAGALGAPPIYMKRDDLTGLAFGGNKTRMLEFSLADALAKGADTIVTGMAVQSNYCRQMAAACAKTGLELHLILRPVRLIDRTEIQGNNLLQRLFGAHITTLDRNDQDLQQIAVAETARRLRAEGKHVYVPRAEDTVDLDAIAYAETVLEIVEQCRAMAIEPEILYTAAADTTQAGLVLALKYLRSPIHVRGINPFPDGPERTIAMAAMANQAARRLGLAIELGPDDFDNDIAFVGAGYGIPTAEGLAAIHLVARQEGILLDPVYTSKAMAALIAEIEAGTTAGRSARTLFAYGRRTSALWLRRRTARNPTFLSQRLAMNIVIPDDYQGAVSTLDCFSRLADHDVTVFNDTVKDVDILGERFQEADALVLIRERTQISEALLARLPRLKLISQTGRGTAHIDVAACTRRGIGVTAGGGSSYATAELTWALVLASMRHLPQEVARLRAGQWQSTLGTGLHGRTLGIWGYGKIGSMVAGYGRAFGMHVVVWGREGSLVRAREDGFATATGKQALFEQSDVLTLHIKLNEETRGIVTAAGPGAHEANRAAGQHEPGRTDRARCPGNCPARRSPRLCCGRRLRRGADT